ncbi:hypothetical protein [Paenibacillus sp. NAIST15-1]|uniref:hypothetical protein n=1 Tax=Paenibacillus sp. NAIST15-1 TaxID=1605994 RepID=UPI00086CA0DA|nr:hypothetical protein [Paenibacillus sp. NAIST15-1]GAV11276.1 hypothetical protein PBN151_1203 [Paenibacillus sp. NAIST15-1]
MKEAIKTDLNGRYIEPTLVADSVTGVFDRMEPVQTNDETPRAAVVEPDESETVLVGYTVAITLPDGLYEPTFDVEGYRNSVKVYEAAYDPESEETTPRSPQSVDGSSFWRNGLTDKEIEALKPKPQPSELELIQQDNASLLLKVADLEVRNQAQVNDTASMLLKNAELELINQQHTFDLASVILQNAQLDSTNQQLAQDYATLLLKLSQKGVF